MCVLKWICEIPHRLTGSTSSKLSLCCQGYRGEGTLSIDKLQFLSGLYKVTLHRRVCSIQLNIQHFTETRTQSSKSITRNRGESSRSRWWQSSATGPVLESIETGTFPSSLSLQVLQIVVIDLLGAAEVFYVTPLTSWYNLWRYKAKYICSYFYVYSCIHICIVNFMRTKIGQNVIEYGNGKWQHLQFRCIMLSCIMHLPIFCIQSS